MKFWPEFARVLAAVLITAAACEIAHHLDDGADDWTPPDLVEQDGRCVPADRNSGT